MYVHSIFKLGCQSESLSAFFRRLPVLGFDQSSCRNDLNALFENGWHLSEFNSKMLFHLNLPRLIHRSNKRALNFSCCCCLCCWFLSWLAVVFFLCRLYHDDSHHLYHLRQPVQINLYIVSVIHSKRKIFFSFYMDSGIQFMAAWINLNTFVLSLLFEKACWSARCIASCTYKPVPVPLPCRQLRRKCSKCERS